MRDRQARYDRFSLDMIDAGSQAVIVDTRGEPPTMFLLDGPGLVVYRLLDKPRTVGTIVRSRQMTALVGNIDVLDLLLGTTGGVESLPAWARDEARALGALVRQLPSPFILGQDARVGLSGFLEQLEGRGLVVSERGRYQATAVARSSHPRAVASPRSIAYRPSCIPTLRGLAELLERQQYVATVERLTGGAPSHLMRRAIRALAHQGKPAEIGDDDWPLVSLLFLGQPLPEPVARRLFGSLLGGLVELGLVTRGRAMVRCDRYAVVPVAAVPFVVSRLRHDESAPGSVAVYLGLDTTELIEHGRRSEARSILDLGCGGGLVGISALLARPGLRVVGTDVCHEAVDVARVNAAMHRVPYEVREGDLYERVAGERFDLILADPPVVAIPDDLAFPIYGAGGPSGDLLLRRMVEGSPARLTAKGRLVAITELHCPPGRVPFVDWVRRWAVAVSGRRVRVEMHRVRHLPATYYRELGQHLMLLPGGEEATARHPHPARRLAEFAATEKIRFGLWAHVVVTLVAGRPSRCRVQWRFRRAGRDSKPRLAMPLRDVEARLWAAYGHPVDLFGDAFTAFLDEATGNLSIDDLARRLVNRQVDGAAGVEPLTDYLTDLATALQMMGLIEA